ncbi:MAG: DUF190 domain-containing protein [Thermovirgaceae bacterium]
MRIILLVGFFGAFSTFSSFILVFWRQRNGSKRSIRDDFCECLSRKHSWYLFLVTRMMELPEKTKLLRIFIGESDRFNRKPLYEAIVHLARERSMAGVTALRGILGLGAHSRIHSAMILRLSEDLPIIVEIVVKPERIGAILPKIDEMMQEGLVTLEDIQVIFYRKEKRHEVLVTHRQGAKLL